jgi:hypothetical protein
MNLDELHKKRVGEWVAAGLKLADIQKRLSSELGVNLTYMEVRLLVDDLKLTPKDTEPPKVATLDQAKSPPAQPGRSAPFDDEEGLEGPEQAAPAAGQVAVSVDQVARPGALVSGTVTFSDGKLAHWYLDQLGRLGLVPKETGYKPSAADLQRFQQTLQNELGRMGF